MGKQMPTLPTQFRPPGTNQRWFWKLTFSSSFRFSSFLIWQFSVFLKIVKMHFVKSQIWTWFYFYLILKINFFLFLQGCAVYIPKHSKKNLKEKKNFKKEKNCQTATCWLKNSASLCPWRSRSTKWLSCML